MMIALSALDRQRFGHVVAKASVGANDDLDALLSECASQDVELLIARCASESLAQVQRMERRGFYLTDTLVYFQKKQVAPCGVALPAGYALRFAEPRDAPLLQAVAARAFEGYAGHYHADPRLDPSRCDEVYSSWAANSCSGQPFCDAVLLITSGSPDHVAAFATLARLNDLSFEGILFGVDPSHQGKGLYAQLMERSQQWGLDQGLVRMVVSTQVTNVAVQKAWCRQGFEPSGSTYTLHKWLT